jgi:hypothetical protein
MERQTFPSHEAQDFRALRLAIVTMAVVLVNVDQCFWRPVVAWADKFRILGANPGCIRGEVVIDLPRLHDRANARFKALVDYIYTVMTRPEADVVTEPAEGAIAETARPPGGSPYAQPLPQPESGGSAACWS